jgi:hypothetical protein
MTIHIGWAFSPNEREKSSENIAHLNSLGLVRGEDYSIERTPGYNHLAYKLTALTDAARKLTAAEAALIVDHGSLCFGGRDFSKAGDIYTGIVHTD